MKKKNLCDSFGPEEVTESFRQAIQFLGGRKYLEQLDLKPTTALAMNHLMQYVDCPEKPYLDMNCMQKDGDRNKVWHYLENYGRVKPYPYECMVDLCVITGEKHPYQIIMTAESEAYDPDAKTIADEENDMVWDLYKLLLFPSPLRLFVTRSSSLHHEKLLERTTELVNCYAKNIGDETSIFSIQFPTALLSTTDAMIAWWARGYLSNLPNVIKTYFCVKEVSK